MFSCVVLATLLSCCGVAVAQDTAEEGCYGAGSIAASVILTFLFSVLLLVGALIIWKRYKSKTAHLIIETDPEKGKGEYAFDNPGFKESSMLAINKAVDKTPKLDTGKLKWNQWSPLTALTTKSEKRKTLDDSALEENAVKVVALRSHDFTGLGFNIEGNMKEGIFIKDILHRGPAFESGKLIAGDRINSVTISFEHMVYEDALTILSYASPYEVIIEAKSGRLVHHTNGQGAQPSHPVYRSASCTDLFNIEKSSRKKLFGDDYAPGSNYSSLQKSRSNMTTLERKESKSPRMKGKKLHTRLSPEQLKLQLEQKIALEVKPVAKKLDLEVQKTENRHQKFGIKVLPAIDLPQKSPKAAENSQNDNNINIEKNGADDSGIDEVDVKKPVVKKREKKLDAHPELAEEFVRHGSLQGSVKRDKNGIPQELPSHMMNAAVVARRNRRNSTENTLDDVDGAVNNTESTKKSKGKAPAPPEPKLEPVKPDDGETKYNSDSDLENDSSVNTIELNSSEITIHQTEDERENRRTASTGDLTKIQKARKTSSGTLERAQSLDITDTGIPGTLKRKGGKIDDMKSDEDLFGTLMLNKEPRLSLILDGLNTCQRNRLRKSTEWGNLEDAIQKIQPDEQTSETQQDNGKIADNVEVNALIDKIMQIRTESINVEPKVVNQIWPSEVDLQVTKHNGKSAPSSERKQEVNGFQKRQMVPVQSPEEPPKQNDITPDTRHIEAPQELKKPMKLEENTDLNEPKTNLKEPQDVNNVISKEVEQSKDVASIPNVEKRQIKPARLSKPEKPEPAKSDEVAIKVDDVMALDLVQNLEETVPEVLPRQRKQSQSNNTDETKTNSLKRPGSSNQLTQNFLINEQMSCSQDTVYKLEDTNVSDDIKVSRHSHNGTDSDKERETGIQSDDMKSVNVVIVTENGKKENGDSNLHSLELSINKTLPINGVTVSTPDVIESATLVEALHTVNNDVQITGPSSLTLELPGDFGDVIESTLNNSTFAPTVTNPEPEGPASYITEIQVVTPKLQDEVQIQENGRNLDHEFENYVKSFDAQSLDLEANLSDFEPNMEDFIDNEPKSMVIEKLDPERELHKIQEIAEEQLKKLPEMRFSTSYESKAPEKRQSQIEVLRSNFEKSPPNKQKGDVVKSRIPIARTGKTPPMSPERRDSRNLDNENDRAILELMSSPTKYQTPNKQSRNVTVTSIRTNSKIPSGLPTYSSAGRPPIPPKRVDSTEDNGNVETSFKQWVFNPASNNNAVTNIVVRDAKDKV